MQYYFRVLAAIIARRLKTDSAISWLLGEYKKIFLLDSKITRASVLASQSSPKKLLAIILMLFLPFSSAEAYQKTIISQDSLDQKVVDAVEKYFKNIKKVAIDIKQTGKHGKVSTGKLLISKPSNFRWNYYAPYPLLIVGNESFVSIYDYEMQQLTNIKPEENIFQFLISDAPLSDEFDIISAYLRNNQYNLLIKHRDFDKRAQLVFSKEPLKLRSISIIDADSSHIKVEFSNFTTVKAFADGIFAIKNPEIFGEPKRYSEKEIEKKIKNAN
jgi:outer membrane lipoprotein-sorting protein